MPGHRRVFEKYPNKYFIETGSFKGETIDIVKNLPYELIYSIDISEEWFNYCLNKFPLDKRIFFFCGESEKYLKILLDQTDAPSTIWLDAHGVPDYANIDRFGKSNHLCPLINELDIIQEHSNRTKLYHTILIDDIRCCNMEGYGFPSKNALIDKLKSINPNYNIIFEDSWEKEDILIAKP